LPSFFELFESIVQLLLDAFDGRLVRVSGVTKCLAGKTNISSRILGHLARERVYDRGAYLVAKDSIRSGDFLVTGQNLDGVGRETAELAARTDGRFR